MQGELTYDLLIKKIKDNEKFSFSRFGDGEFECIMRHGKQNCDGSRYYSSLGVRLSEILMSNPSYYIGIQPKAMTSHITSNTVHNYLNRMTNVNLCNSDIIHDASIEGNIEELTELIDNSCLVIGPHHITTHFAHVDSIKIPESNAYLLYSSILEKLYLATRFNHYDTVILCAGMMTKLLIDDINALLPKIGTSFIDCGSVFDPYAGRATRKYHTEIIRRIEKDV